jgi:hypothetical protein
MIKQAARVGSRQDRCARLFSARLLFSVVCKECLSSRQGNPPRSPNSKRLSTLRRMRSWSEKPRMRNARSTGYATN